MASAAYRKLEGISPAQQMRREAEQEEAVPSRRSRQSKAQARLLAQTALALGCTLLFYLSLSYLLGPVLIPMRTQVARLLLLFIVIPHLIVQWRNWIQARKGIAELGILGALSKTELTHVTTQRMAMKHELKDSRPYIDVMHNQIGDSLAESEREVLEVIKQIDMLNEKAVQQRTHIADSIKSGQELTDNTHLRVETTSRSSPRSICSWKRRLRSSGATSSALKGLPSRCVH